MAFRRAAGLTLTALNSHRDALGQNRRLPAIYSSAPDTSFPDRCTYGVSICSTSSSVSSDLPCNSAFPAKGRGVPVCAFWRGGTPPCETKAPPEARGNAGRAKLASSLSIRCRDCLFALPGPTRPTPDSTERATGSRIRGSFHENVKSIVRTVAIPPHLLCCTRERNLVPPLNSGYTGHSMTDPRCGCNQPTYKDTRELELRLGRFVPCLVPCWVVAI